MTASTSPAVTRAPSWTLSSVTRPATGGRTFAVRAGSASTTAGKVRLREIERFSISAMSSRVRSGEVGGTVMRDPSTV